MRPTPPSHLTPKIRARSMAAVAVVETGAGGASSCCEASRGSHKNSTYAVPVEGPRVRVLCVARVSCPGAGCVFKGSEPHLPFFLPPSPHLCDTPVGPGKSVHTDVRILWAWQMA